MSCKFQRLSIEDLLTFPMFNYLTLTALRPKLFAKVIIDIYILAQKLFGFDFYFVVKGVKPSVSGTKDFCIDG